MRLVPPVLTRVSKSDRRTLIPAVLVALAVSAALPAPPALAQASSFSVTLRLGAHVIGPDTAFAVVVPDAASHDRTDVWITLRPGPAVSRLDSLAHADAGRHRPLGVCDIVVRDARGTVLRTYHLSGCYVSRVEPAGDTRRVALGYSSISTP